MRKKKVILSRKGFDDSTGGKPSPLINGKFISLPIPRVESGVFYKNLSFNQHTNYLEVMKDLNIKYFSEAHLDPDIRQSVLPNRHKEWRGLFGQSGNAQASLLNEGITTGDIFLFFGWFREAEHVKGAYRYKKNAPNIHAIYGYLEVDEMIDLNAPVAIPRWALYHPHIKQKQDYCHKKNGLYIATNSLTFDPSKNGWGCFNYAEQLVLTKRGQNKRSVWELPPVFENEENKFKGKVSFTSLRNENIQVEFTGLNNQELYISDKEEVVRWAEDIIKICKTYK
ncbi:hypothetical protein [Peribacillus tepidiphilus]|uniref:Nmad3 family putative nucleotide modification protein n=1 Tax=Peribacillus tepidiphilus TaxID=2652445 RepID=UPI0012912A37|nr:hypothetical protein [Peribacillus tepidiphilus]